MQAGVDGLLRDRTRPSRIAPLGSDMTDLVVALTLATLPGEVTHRAGRAMAKTAKISLNATARIWRTHGLQPHRIRQSKLSNDPHFAAELRHRLALCRWG